MANDPAAALHTPLKLFDSKVRVRGGKPATARAYEQLDLAWPEYYGHARDLLEAWFHQLPEDAKKNIHRRFRNTKDDAAHWGAFFELYLHSLGIAAGWDPYLDAGRESQLDRIPDHQFTLPTGPCAIEARTVRGDDVVDPNARGRVAQLREALDTLTDTNHHLLHVNLQHVGDSSPPAALKRDVQEWLATLDPDSGEDVDPQTFQRAGWKMKLRASPVKPELRDDPYMRGIGTWSIGSAGHEHVIKGERTIRFDGPRPLDDVGRITKAVTAKRKHGYDVGEMPFVIALLCRGDFVEDRDIAAALFSRDVWGTDAPSESRRSVSAVLTVTELSATSVAISAPTVWTNPHADRPLPTDAFPFRRFDVGPDDRLHETAARVPIAELLGIDPLFPGRAARPSPHRISTTD